MTVRSLPAGTSEVRFWVRLISSEALAQYMQHRGFTVRSLAAVVDADTRKHAAKGDGAATSSRTIIGLLRSGNRSTCQPYTARAIERCLGAPGGSLFVPQVSSVLPATGRAA